MTTESESSLPTNTAPVFDSSPPIIDTGSKQLSAEMDIDQSSKSEPLAGNQDGGTRSPIRRSSSTETERPSSAQRVNSEANAIPLNDNEVQELDDESDPFENITDFDWDDLADRYHTAIRESEIEEAKLIQEWEQLMSYFRIWAESGVGHETGRTFSRLQTRIAYVQNSEQRLEKTRNHYINVVKAFESALDLLQSIDRQ